MRNPPRISDSGLRAHREADIDRRHNEAVALLICDGSTAPLSSSAYTRQLWPVGNRSMAYPPSNCLGPAPLQLHPPTVAPTIAPLAASTATTCELNTPVTPGGENGNQGNKRTQTQRAAKEYPKPLCGKGRMPISNAQGPAKISRLVSHQRARGQQDVED